VHNQHSRQSSKYTHTFPPPHRRNEKGSFLDRDERVSVSKLLGLRTVGLRCIVEIAKGRNKALNVLGLLSCMAVVMLVLLFYIYSISHSHEDRH
jgi:hypothetical protein